VQVSLYRAHSYSTSHMHTDVFIALGGRCANGVENDKEDSSGIGSDSSGTQATLAHSLGSVSVGAVFHVYPHSLYGICSSVGPQVVSQHASEHVSRLAQGRRVYETGTQIAHCHGTVLSRVSSSRADA
jgi:hypothetical protein